MNNEMWSNLRKIRKKQNKSLEEVAEEVGLNASSLSRIETGKSAGVSFKTIYDLSRYYGVTLEKIVSEKIEDEEKVSNDQKKIVISQDELPYYRVVQEAKNEGLTAEETKTIISMFKRIAAVAQAGNIRDEYCKLANKAKANGVSEFKFQNMVEYLITNERLEN